MKSPTKVHQPNNSKDKAKRSMPSTTNCYVVRAASLIQSKMLTHSSAYVIGRVSLVDVGGCSCAVCLLFILILFQLLCHGPICGARKMCRAAQNGIVRVNAAHVIRGIKTSVK